MMGSLFKSRSTVHVASKSTPSSPPSLYSFTAPPRSSSALPPSTSSFGAPSSKALGPPTFSTPPCSPPASPQQLSKGSLFPPSTPRNPASSASSAVAAPLSPPPEKYQQLQGVEEVVAQTFMGKKGAGAKKKGKAKAKAKTKAAPVASAAPALQSTTGKDSVTYSHKASSTSGPPVDAVLYASGKHKHKKHLVDYTQDYDDQVSEDEPYWEDHWEDERRGRSARPRLLWRSNLDDSVLEVLDAHSREARGRDLPRLTGETSTEGRKWSRELEKCGL